MLKTVATAFLTMTASACALTAEPEAPAANTEQTMQAESHPNAAGQAMERAKQALASRLDIATSEISVVGAEPQTWPDSSMGCGRPGTVAMQVITEGYAVMLQARDKTYRVHVSASSAVVCDRPALVRKELRRPVNMRLLNDAVDTARIDLARRLGASVAQVRVVRTERQAWPDSGLGCPRDDETIVKVPVNGHRIVLEHAGRTYTYHTDLKDVRPCPPIETK